MHLKQFVLLLAIALPFSIFAKNPTNSPYPKKEKHDGVKMTILYDELVIDGSIDETWKALMQDYIHVGDIAKNIVKSGTIGQAPTMGDGAERYCEIDFNGKDILVKERIFDIQESSSQKEYTYDVYEWKNYPLKKMHVVFGVKKNSIGQTVIYNAIKYRLKPGFMTGMVKGQLRDSIVDSLLAYRHYIEKGKGNVEAKVLRDMYLTD